MGSGSIDITARQVYLIFCALVANSPDIDSIVTLVLKAEHHLWHRTWSHSYFGSLFFIPALSYGLYSLMSPFIGLKHALLITSLCFYSHLVTDWITTYGIALDWTPWRASPFYAMGVIIIFDFVTISIWYLCFMASWYRLASPTAVLVVFLLSVSLWLCWKRVWLYRAYLHSLTLSKAPKQNVWLQPSGFFPSTFGQFQWQEDSGQVVLLSVIKGSQCPWPRHVTKLQAIKDAFFGPDLGYTRVAPRDALQRTGSKGAAYRKFMLKHGTPSLILATAHLAWFVMAVLGRV
jgi:hypothetical protein